MAIDWGGPQFIVGVIACLLELRWGIFSHGFRHLIRYVRLRKWPQEGQCEYLSWEAFRKDPVLDLHHCQTRACGDHSFKSLFSWPKETTHWIQKPTGLPLNKAFLCTDYESILAFILCAVQVEDTTSPIRTIPDQAQIGDLGLKCVRDKEGGVVLVDIALPPRLSFRQLTKHEVTCLMRGYPPFYREWIDCHGMMVPSAIESDDDVRRGGWVIGVGLSSTKPIPYYMDTFYKKEETLVRRGEVFWRAMRRVERVLENNIKVAFANNRNVEGAVNAVAYMLSAMTDSGYERMLDGTALRRGYNAPQIPVLSQKECITAMKIFNDSPGLSSQKLEEMRVLLEPILLPVLHAAVVGVARCMEYMKNDGRELGRRIPKLLIQEERVFIAC